ncbi:putative carotenoid biosynthesis protein [Salinarchaeum sp. Harcht-Bsk1]|uniref:bisanhydrobacterioruberin hydratase n=1 Tax=Salinarchaeum sp. Harcht-Bsk1 TaxID=1333523 RepID=UPI0003422DB1|nr:bisanhydrobacterioruberin hydratase [Salinarchaeum sp. Harcht-Bsk1]AGN00900.1 putative carotenoid biosynthesis protein [Salinarchaeum sp. Harcht-Bsk1]
MDRLGGETGRERVESRLDSIVHDNRVTIAVTFPLVGVVLLLAGEAGYVPDALAFNPYLMVAAVTIMALPLASGIAPIVDRRAAVGLLALAAFTWAIELVGVQTGLPYGEFTYERELGPMVFGDVPLALPIFFVPILLNSYLLGILVLGDRADRLAIRFPTVVALVVVLDLVLDPGAVALDFWGWTDPGVYYGVPVINFLGWILAATVAVGILTVAFDHDAIVSRLETCPYLLDDLINFGIFWGLVNVAAFNLVPALVATGILLVLVRAPWFDFAGLPFGSRTLE